ncbi:MAG: ATP-binding protein [Aureliella sp.]
MNSLQPQSVELPLRVLIVDDDAAMCTSLSRILALDCYHVDVAGSADALNARSDLDSFFAILLDRRLPDGDASEIVLSIRNKAPNAAIMIVTGYADIESTLLAIRQGVDDYLIKPVEPEVLRARLKSLATLYRTRMSLRESEARMRFLVENLPAGAVYVDNQRLFMNRTVKEITGYSSEQIQTVADWFETLCRERAQECRQKYCQVKRDGFSQKCQLRVLRSDGVSRVLEIAGYQYDLHEVWLVTDITELDDAQAQLVQAERLAAIGQMVTGLAHESRNALQRARGCLDLLELDLEKQNEQLDLVNRIRRSLGDLQRNYEEVRSYAAPIILQREWTNICDCIRLAFADLECEHPGSGHELSITPDNPPDSVAVNLIDRHRIVQVFRNVIDNAMAASPAGTKISVHIRQQQTGTVTWQCIDISDQGSGMSTETQTRLFEPFYTTKQSGTGLGMAICRRIIDEHQGTISAQSRVDETDGANGTTIQIQLPWHQPPETAVQSQNTVLKVTNNN